MARSRIVVYTGDYRLSLVAVLYYDTFIRLVTIKRFHSTIAIQLFPPFFIFFLNFFTTVYVYTAVYNDPFILSMKNYP